MHLKTDRKLPV